MNVISLQTDGKTDRYMHRKRTGIRKVKFTWTFSSGELKNILIKQITWGKVCVFNTQTGSKTNGVGINFDYIQLLNMVMIIEFSLGLYTEFYPTSTVYIYIWRFYVQSCYISKISDLSIRFYLPVCTFNWYVLHTYL